MSKTYVKLILLLICSALLVMPVLAVSTGAVVSWGRDSHGEVSQTPTGNRYVAIAGGGEQSLALKSDGSIVSWGSDEYGQVSQTPTGNNYVAIDAGEEYSLALKSDGSIVSWGYDGSGQVSQTPTGNNYVAIAAGGWHCLALKSDGSIVSWGNDYWGEVSQTPTDTGYVAIEGGDTHSLALKSDGSIVSWGYDHGETPIDTGYIAIAAGTSNSLALKSDGSIVSWGDNAYGLISETPTGNDYVAIAAGKENSLALKSDGSIVSWGYDGNNQVSHTPTDIGYFAIEGGGWHCLALEANHPPVADAGPDQTDMVYDTVTFDGSGSSDDGNIVSYAWDFGDSTSGSGEMTSHTYMAAGIYTSTLTVTDYEGLTGSDTAVITIKTPGSLLVTSSPSQAKIYINGIDAGQFTRWTFNGMAPGEYNVYVTLEGYTTSETEKVTVVSDKTVKLNFKLKKVK